MAKILLIDDDQNMHQIIPLFLEDANHEVLSATSALAGLEMASTNRPDLIILDMAMPGMDGGEFLKKLKAQTHTADIPVIIYTVHDLDELNSVVAEFKPAGYLRKPVNMQSLQKSVDKALNL
ncbi:MAG: response regulator [Rhodospirillales bacterium]|nr:response regulator [Rhodospirillales bacterium]